MQRTVRFEATLHNADDILEGMRRLYTIKPCAKLKAAYVVIHATKSNRCVGIDGSYRAYLTYLRALNTIGGYTQPIRSIVSPQRDLLTQQPNDHITHLFKFLSAEETALMSCTSMHFRRLVKLLANPNELLLAEYTKYLTMRTFLSLTYHSLEETVMRKLLRKYPTATILLHPCEIGARVTTLTELVLSEYYVQMEYQNIQYPVLRKFTGNVRSFAAIRKCCPLLHHLKLTDATYDKNPNDEIYARILRSIAKLPLVHFESSNCFCYRELKMLACVSTLKKCIMGVYVNEKYWYKCACTCGKSVTRRCGVCGVWRPQPILPKFATNCELHVGYYDLITSCSQVYSLSLNAKNTYLSLDLHKYENLTSITGRMDSLRPNIQWPNTLTTLCIPRVAVMHQLPQTLTHLTCRCVDTPQVLPNLKMLNVDTIGIVIFADEIIVRGKIKEDKLLQLVRMKLKKLKIYLDPDDFPENFQTEIGVDQLEITVVMRHHAPIYTYTRIV